MNDETHTCMCCGSVNRIPLYTLMYESDALAFSCWNCRENSWLDDDSIYTHVVLNNISRVQAQMDLDNNVVPMVDGEFNG